MKTISHDLQVKAFYATVDIFQQIYTLIQISTV